MEKTLTKRPVQKEDLFRLKSLMDGRLSPKGDRIVYVVSHVDAEKEEEYAALWLYDLSNGQARQLTSGTSRDYSPAWAPDGSQIAFVSTREETPQIYLISPDGGEARRLTSLKNGVGEGPLWSPDGSRLAFTAAKEIEMPDYSKPYRVTRHIYRFNGIGYLEGVVQDVFCVEVESGENKQLTDDLSSNNSLQWSPDGKKILFLASFAPDTLSLNPVLRSVDLQGELQDILSGWSSVMSPLWMPDGKQILFAGQPDGLEMGCKNDLWLVSAQGGEPVCRTRTLPNGVFGGLQGDFPAAEFQGRLLLSADGKEAFAPVQNGGSLQVYHITLDGAESCTSVLGGERLNALMDMQAGKLLYAVSTLNAPADLYLSDLNGENEKRLTELNTAVLDELLLPETEHFFFKGAKGEDVEGWLMKPVQGEAPYPTVLYIHGGPTGAFGEIFTFDFQMLAGAGYAVLFINPHGSSGYGDAFATAITADWGNLDYQDMMAAVDFVIEKGWADAERLGVAGLSYGGYMTTWIVGQTRRFKAAVPENPVTNLVSLYGTSDVSASLLVQAFKGKPYEVPEVYKRCSPVTQAHTCTTPTLLIQGEADYRCPAEQSEQFYTILKANGCIAEMLRLPGGSHLGAIVEGVALRKAQNEGLLDWMDRYLM